MGDIAEDAKYIDLHHFDLKNTGSQRYTVGTQKAWIRKSATLKQSISSWSNSVHA